MKKSIILLVVFLLLYGTTFVITQIQIHKLKERLELATLSIDLLEDFVELSQDLDHTSRERLQEYIDIKAIIFQDKLQDKIDSLQAQIDLNIGKIIHLMNWKKDEDFQIKKWK